MAAITTAGAPASTPRQQRPRRIIARPGTWVIWGVVTFFFVNLLGVIFTVLVDSFGTSWFGTWLPQAFTTHWYGDAWKEFALRQVLTVTAQVAVSVVVLSVAIGGPAAHVLARRDFPFKKLLTLLFLLPILVPPITYGIPLAIVLNKWHLGGHLSGVILANLVPAVPFVVLTMTPFIEQIDPKIEAAARMCGARTGSVMLRILSPLILPGLLASGILVLIRTVGMFELSFLTAGPSSQTLVVSLYAAVFGAGIRAQQEVDAMAVIYTASMMVLLLVALRFVNPTQLVTRVRDEAMT